LTPATSESSAEGMILYHRPVCWDDHPIVLLYIVVITVIIIITIISIIIIIITHRRLDGEGLVLFHRGDLHGPARPQRIPHLHTTRWLGAPYIESRAPVAAKHNRLCMQHRVIEA
jgi:hypothetical protein